MFLTGKEKLEFIETSVTWIEGRDIIDSCFVLTLAMTLPFPGHRQALSRGDCGVYRKELGATFGKAPFETCCTK